MEFFEEGSKIESEHSELFAKEITASVPQNRPDIGLCLKYKCKRDGEITITKELDPKEHLINENSNLNNEDVLKANQIYVLAKGIKKIKPKKKGGHSGRHSTQQINFKDYTFAEITKPFKHIQNALENRRNKLK